jgi:GT2 family glycosyltransferase
LALGYAKTTGNLIVWANDDCRFGAGCLNEMAKFLGEQPQPCIVEPEVGPPCHYDGKQFARWGMASRSTIETIGGFFDPAFNAYFADIDMSLRCWIAGGRVLTCPSAYLRMSNRRDDDINRENVSRFHAHDEDLFFKRWKRA